jgi:NitT/TauT family transport system substrate-binding protein
MKRLLCAIAFAATAWMFTVPVDAADKVRLVISQRMPFELYGAEQAKAEGYFAEENLDVEISYATGGADTLQTLITGSQDITTGNGAMGVVAAIAKGAPLKIIASNGRGTGDVFWYVPAASPIKSIKDLEGKELVYSRPGSTTHLIAQSILKLTGVNAKLVSVGDPSASRTMVMSGQVATAWAPFPANYDLVRKGETRMVVRGDEAKDMAIDTIRAIVANANWLKANRNVAERFLRANWKGLLFHYALSDRAVERYSKHWNIDPADTRRGPEFSPLANQTYQPFGNLEALERTAIELKMLREPLTAEQKANLFDLIWNSPPLPKS